MSIKIVLADSQNMGREGLECLLNSNDEFGVVGIAKTTNEILPVLKKTQCDLIIMDIAMKGLNATELTQQISTKHPNVKILALSTIAGKRKVVDMLKAGAAGYLLRDCTFAELIDAINIINGGKTYLCDAVKSLVVEEFATNIKVPARLSSELTERECLILKLLSEGKSSKEVALEISKSSKTVDASRRVIMNKLEIKSFACLVKYAIREGLTTAEE